MSHRLQLVWMPAVIVSQSFSILTPAGTSVGVAVGGGVFVAVGVAVAVAGGGSSLFTSAPMHVSAGSPERVGLQEPRAAPAWS